MLLFLSALFRIFLSFLDLLFLGLTLSCLLLGVLRNRILSWRRILSFGILFCAFERIRQLLGLQRLSNRHFLPFLIELKSASLYFLVGKKFLVELLVGDEVVLLQARLIQVVLLAAIENAFKVTPPLSSLMDLQMLLQITTGGELLRAVGTFEWLIASMDSLMPYQVGYLGESLGAAGMVAGVWLLLVMYSSVLLER